jgi:hypothetical protein
MDIRHFVDVFIYWVTGVNFFIYPTSPAAIIEENARYGLADGSGALYSMRFVL